MGTTTNDIQEDWELLLDPVSSDSESSAPVSFDEIDSGALIQVNYFSLDAPPPRGDVDHEELDDDDDKSDNPSWIDPDNLEQENNPTRYLHKDPGGELWSDTNSERSNDRKSLELDDEQTVTKDIIFTEQQQQEEETIIQQQEEMVHDKEIENKDGNNNNNNNTSSLVMWWKMPMDFLRYFVFPRMSPVWTVTVAAAAMGFMILGRRLYTMKKKSKGLHIKVAVDDKKVSQVMSRAARLNEAFSVVKRVPAIRPSFPAIGVTPWPVMSLR